MIDLDILEGSLEDFKKDDDWVDLRLMIDQSYSYLPWIW